MKYQPEHFHDITFRRKPLRFAVRKPVGLQETDT